MCAPRRRPRAFCLSGGNHWPWDRTTPDLPPGPSGGRPSLPTAQGLEVGNHPGLGVAKVGDESSLRKRGAVSEPLRRVLESAYCPLGAGRTEATVPNRKRPLDRRLQALRGVFDAVAMCPREDSNLHGRKGHVTLNNVCGCLKSTFSASERLFRRTSKTSFPIYSQAVPIYPLFRGRTRDRRLAWFVYW